MSSGFLLASHALPAIKQCFQVESNLSPPRGVSLNRPHAHRHWRHCMHHRLFSRSRQQRCQLRRGSSHVAMTGGGAGGVSKGERHRTCRQACLMCRACTLTTWAAAFILPMSLAVAVSVAPALISTAYFFAMLSGAVSAKII